MIETWKKWKAIFTITLKFECTEAENSCHGFRRQNNLTMTRILFPFLFAKKTGEVMNDDRVKSLIFKHFAKTQTNNDMTLMTSLHAHVFAKPKQLFSVIETRHLWSHHHRMSQFQISFLIKRNKMFALNRTFLASEIFDRCLVAESRFMTLILSPSVSADRLIFSLKLNTLAYLHAKAIKSRWDNELWFKYELVESDLYNFIAF